MLNLGVALLPLLLAASSLVQATPMPGAEPGIPPVVWELVEIVDGDDEPLAIAEPERYTVQFLPEGDLAIGADCNRMTGTFTTSRDRLDITLGLSTLALCPPDSQVEPFQRLLDGATTFAFGPDGELILSGDDGSLTLRTALMGVIWEWHEFQGSDDSIVAPENSEEYTLTFLPEGKLAIQADCNRAIGAFTVDGAALDLVVGGVTRALCPPGSLMESFLRDLDDASSHVFRDGNLYLALPIDAGIMEFVARYEQPPAATPVANS